MNYIGVVIVTGLVQ